MTTEIKMPDEVASYLAIKPGSYPDFRHCSEDTSHQPVSVPMPALAALIQHMGGLDAIPDSQRHATPDWTPWARLRSKQNSDVLAEIHRYGKTLCFGHWHLRDTEVVILFGLPADWTTAPWKIEHVAVRDMYSRSAELDRQAAEACNFLVEHYGEARTYCHLRVDQFID
jgi:hypothetical protein